MGCDWRITFERQIGDVPVNIVCGWLTVKCDWAVIGLRKEKALLIFSFLRAF
jgi:hypothetical protein